TKGPVQAEVLLVDETDTTALEQYKGKMKNKVILLYRSDKISPSFNADAKRYTNKELEDMVAAAPAANQQTDTTFRNMIAAMRRANYLSNKTKEMALKDGAVAFFSMNPLGKDGTVFVTGGGSYKVTDPENL